MMRKPADLYRYVPVETAARFLEISADRLREESPGMRIKIALQISYWDNAWAKTEPAHIRKVVPGH